MGNHNYLLGQTLDLHSNRGERNPIFLSAWVIGGWSFYLWKFLKVSALLSSIWAARMSWEGSSAVLPPLLGWGPHTPLTPLTTSMVSEWPPRYSVWASRNSGQKTENRISSQIYFFLRSSSRCIWIPAGSFLSCFTKMMCMYFNISKRRH